MIKIESLHIEEVRGIRKLDIDFHKETFAISGPNGSGKSGVIDAIEFALTGQMSRLTGRGTKGLSLPEHGPHVDKVRFPDAAFVEIKVYLPALRKSATITRTISAPRKPRIVPADDDVKAALDEVASHPEVTLSRREILRFILVEPTKRSEEIQALLKLEEIGQLRSALNTAQNKLGTAHRAAMTQVQSSRDALQRHLQIATFQAADVLGATNKRREALGLAKIERLTADTSLDAGLAETGKPSDFNKQSALRDIAALTDAVVTVAGQAARSVDSILVEISALESDRELLNALQERSFIEKGLELVDGIDCPLCGLPWDNEQHLRDHLRAKLAKSEEAGRAQQSMLTAGGELGRLLAKHIALLAAVQKVAVVTGESAVARALVDWRADLDALKPRLSDLDALLGLKNRLETDWLSMPPSVLDDLSTLRAVIEQKPDQTSAIEAQTFLTTAQLRLGDYREAMRKEKAADIAQQSAKRTYEIYCTVLERELEALYQDVQGDFSSYYRMINEDDEAGFTAKLTPHQGSLDLDVNFYERGLFPPGAYHSEGHQDGMGVCLYLALMKRLLGERFTIALLDDVVMSVDAGHRYQFCRLLKTHFPDTQFIITTHDRLWAEQMKSAGLVTAKTSLAFHGWTVDTGPLVESNEEIWEEIDASVARGKVEVAAAALRHHLEYVSRLLADQLGASPVFRADGNYELGELLPAVLSRMKSLLGKAAEAAQSWGNAAQREDAASRKARLSSSNGAINVEQWAVNKAVHYNEWANFGRTDFTPVVAAFKELLENFQCDVCHSWLYVSPRGAIPESLRCNCSHVNLNLRTKPK